MDVAGRLSRLRALLEPAGVDALLVASRSNLRYLTGFTGSAGMLLATLDGAFLATDGRYQDQAGDELARAGVHAEVSIGNPPAQLAAIVDAAGGLGRVGFESEHLSFAHHARFTAGDAFGPDRLVPLGGLVEGLRKIKDAGELARIRAAAGIADDALAAVIAQLEEWFSGGGGITEADLAVELDFQMRRRGASEPAFETIVAGGPNGAMPHHRASADRLEPHQPIVIDFGATVEGYRSDMTRTVWVGDLADGEQERIVAVVTSSQLAGVAAVKAAVEARAVDAACREVIDAAGWVDAFMHGTGHGVGLDIHEAPWVGASSEEWLEVGNVVTVEPGVYLPGVGGVRIEDTVVVTSGGCEVLTRAPKQAVKDGRDGAVGTTL